MRIIIKGGVWKNTEDEVLKAAVMKYGLNQWARIASLLHRKTPKQCKARWYEWLDPSIKKTEWSRDEEEKLLHLAKLFPQQWRTIAPLVGRTAAQCLEHYEKLLNQAQAKAAGEDEPEEDPRRLRPGEIDMHPETKPARPDPVDMDEDEKEMLSEARARLANTQGKKAKRKARERQLEEARRLAGLQKARELKAAGIEVGERRRKRSKFVDLNAEIPFHRETPAGFFDTAQEDADAEARKKFQPVLQQKLDGKTNAEQDEEDRRKERERRKRRREEDLPGAMLQVNRAENMGESARKRSKLALPAPQVSESELQDIVKMEAQGLAASEAVRAGGGASDDLLSQYSMTPQVGGILSGAAATTTTTTTSALRTPRTPALRDQLLTEAQNLAAMESLQTPLKGGANTPMPSTSFEGLAPAHHPISTPNMVLSTPGRAGQAPQGGVPGPGATPSMGGRTPRDSLNINHGDDVSELGGATPQAVRAHQKSLKHKLRAGLQSLPAPKNDFDIVLPEDDGADAGVDAGGRGPAREEDAADLDDRERARRAAEADAEFKRQSQAVQRQLPRPRQLNYSVLRVGEDRVDLDALQRADELVKSEMLAMLANDAVSHPVKGQAQLPRRPPRLAHVSDEDMAAARALLGRETEALRSSLKHNGTDDMVELGRVWEACNSELTFLPSEKRYGRTALASKKERLEAHERDLERSRSIMAKEAKKAAKVERRATVLLGGFQSRAEKLYKRLGKAHEDARASAVELESFQLLRTREEAAALSRTEALREEVETQARRERRLQERYKALVERKSELEAHLGLSVQNAA